MRNQNSRILGEAAEHAAQALERGFSPFNKKIAEAQD